MAKEWRVCKRLPLASEEIEILRQQKKFPCMSTCRRYIRQWHNEGNILAKLHTGNKFAIPEIHGNDLFNLVLYRIAFPKAIGVEVRAFIKNRNPNLEKEHSPSQLCRAEKRLGISMKVGSTTSKEAYKPINLLKREDYWFRNYPFGIANVDTEDIIDIDEAQFKLTSQDRKYGKAATNKRVDAKGMYKKGESTVTLILGISASEDNQFAFAQQYDEGTTDLVRFYTYMRDFIDYLAEERPDQSFCFTMDNLNIHKHPVIIQSIHAAGHRIVYRAPYWSCDGAIEYVFNTLHTFLLMDEVAGVTTSENLMVRIDNHIYRLAEKSFRPYFDHVGFH